MSAPAGSGKTVAVASWLQERPQLSAAWITIEETDTDPVRLWTAIATAVDRLRPGIGRPALALLKTPRVQIEQVVDELLNGLSGYGGQAVIVLDDVHNIADDDGLRSLGYAVERLPRTTRLIALTRADPGIRLSRFRARGALGELRAADLAFSVDEVSALMAQHGVVQLEREDVELLAARTEGWPAGVGLAGMWLAGMDDPREHLRAFSASNRHVADYLTTEVLDILAPEIRSFLLRTSVLTRFTAGLCDAVLEAGDSAQRLAAIERSNLFLVPLDGNGEWYRYHHLFRELLVADLRAADPEEASALNRRAAAWFSERGLVEDALEQLEATGDAAALADLLESQQATLIRAGLTDRLIHWLARLPDEQLASHPILAAGGALASGMLGQPAEVRRRFLAVAEASHGLLPEAGRQYVETAVAMIGGALLDDELATSRARAQLAADTAQAAVPDLAVPALAALAYIDYLGGDLQLAREAADASLARPEAPMRPHGLVMAHAVHAMVEGDAGRITGAVEEARRAVTLGSHLGLAGSWSAGSAHHALGQVLLLDEDAREAERELERARTLRASFEPRLDTIHSLLVLVRARIARGRLTLARSELTSAQELLTAFADAGTLRAMAADVERELDDALARQQPVSDPPTASELAILQLLAGDLSQREIGDELFLSLNTVKTHSRNLYAKLGAHSRAEAVENAHALGLIDPTPQE